MSISTRSLNISLLNSTRHFTPLTFPPITSMNSSSATMASSDSEFHQLHLDIGNFTQQFLKETTELNLAVRDRLMKDQKTTCNRKTEVKHINRPRRQLGPDLKALQSGYRNVFSRRKGKPHKSKSQEDTMPIVLVPKDKETECITNNALSSFGFLGFMLNVVNAVVNVANNINNNLNGNNNNDNNNNQNDLNSNQVTQTQTIDNMNPPVMTGIGRRLQRLQSMRQAFARHLSNIEDYKVKKRRRKKREAEILNKEVDNNRNQYNEEIELNYTDKDNNDRPPKYYSSASAFADIDEPSKNSPNSNIFTFKYKPTSDLINLSLNNSNIGKSSVNKMDKPFDKSWATSQFSSTSSSSCQADLDIVDEALLAAVALLDMWRVTLFEDDPFCVAMEMCDVTHSLSRVSKLTGAIAQVAGVAAANMLKNIQGINPEFLINASEVGFSGGNCSHEFQECELY